MAKLLILFHSQSGNTLQLAQSAYRGALAVEEVETRLLRATDAGLDELLWCDGLLLGTPENFGYMSGGLKDFFDRTYYPAQDRVTAKPYALFISCENDGSGAVSHIERIARGYALKPVLEPLICRGAITQSCLAQAQELGMTMAAGLDIGIY